MKVYVVQFWDGNTMADEAELYVHATAKGADERVGQIIKENLHQISDPGTKGQIAGALDNGDIEAAYELFSVDGGPTGMLGIEVTAYEVDK